MESKRGDNALIAEVSEPARARVTRRSREMLATSPNKPPNVHLLPPTEVDLNGRQQAGGLRREDVRSKASEATIPALSNVDEILPLGDVDSSQPPTQRSYDRLSNEIVRLILHDKLGPSERLPSERILSERLNVSRTSLREAIIALEIRGVVEVKSGSGIYVRALTPMSFLGELSTGPFELLRGRLIMEPEICAVAAVEAKDANFDAIYQSIAAMRSTVEDKRANELADRSFHVAIAIATGNDMLGQIVGAVWDRRKGDMWEKIEEHFHTSALRQSAIDDHQRIFNALRARDPIMAKTQMKMHIERVIREFGKAW